MWTSWYRETLEENSMLLGTSWACPVCEALSLCKPVIFRAVLEKCKLMRFTFLDRTHSWQPVVNSKECV